jgi:hypothetical protein
MTQTIWRHQVFVISAAEAMPGAIAALDIAFPCDDGAPRNPANPAQYGQELSANGADPVTHYGAAFCVTEEIRLALESIGLASTPGVSYWRASNPEGILTATNHAPSVASIGQSWAWDQSLAAVSVVPVVRPLKLGGSYV